MDLIKIREVLDLPIQSDEVKTRLILSVIAEDKEAIPYVLTLLGNERETKKELIKDMNSELSRCHIAIDKPEMLLEDCDGDDGFTRDFIRSEVKKFYIKYKGIVSHNFNYKF